MVLKESTQILRSTALMLESRGIPHVLMQIGNVNCIVNLYGHQNISKIVETKGYFKVGVVEKTKIPLVNQHMNMQMGRPHLNTKTNTVTKSARILRDKRFERIILPVYDIVSL